MQKRFCRPTEYKDAVAVNCASHASFSKGQVLLRGGAKTDKIENKLVWRRDKDALKNRTKE
jgi:hypothetical protein